MKKTITTIMLATAMISTSSMAATIQYTIEKTELPSICQNMATKYTTHTNEQGTVIDLSEKDPFLKDAVYSACMNQTQGLKTLFHKKKPHYSITPKNVIERCQNITTEVNDMLENVEVRKLKQDCRNSFHGQTMLML